MEIVGFLHGGAPVIKKYQVAQDVDVIGLALLASTGAEAGLDLSTTTNAADMAGINLDTATYVTAQQSGGSDVERTVECVINPDVILKIRMSGGAASSTALSKYAITTATTDGLDCASTNLGSNDMDAGSVWFFDGVNQGQKRKIGAWTNATTADPIVAFNGDHQIGDNVMVAPVFPMDIDSATITLTTELDQMDASAAISTGAAEFTCIETVLGDKASEGETTSYILAVPNDHFLNKLA